MKKMPELDHNSTGAPASRRKLPELSAAMQIHDTINQTLFSVLLIAEVLPNIWERDAAEGRARLDELRVLTQGAMKDMNALFKEIEAEGVHGDHRGARVKRENPGLAG